MENIRFMLYLVVLSIGTVLCIATCHLITGLLLIVFSTIGTVCLEYWLVDRKEKFKKFTI